MAIAGILTAYAAEWLGARVGLLVFGMAVVLLALLLTVVWVKDTLPWAKAETAAHKAARRNPCRATRKVSPSIPPRAKCSH